MANVEQLEAVIIARTPVLRSIVLRIIHKPDDVEDVLQDALILAFCGLDKFEGRSALASWLTRIVINAAYMHLRRKPKMHFVSIDEPQERTGLPLSETIASPDPSYLERQCKVVSRLICKVTPIHREAMRLRFVYGLNTRESALRLNIPEGTLKGKVSRGKKQLRKMIATQSVISGDG
jgi:RNA polymerase sigma-70 factor, ECF subfamily